MGRYDAFSLHSSPDTRSNSFYKQAHGFEASTGRIDTITGYKGSFTAKLDYNYRSDSNLLDKITITNGGSTTYQTVNYGCEANRDLLSFIQNKNGSNATLYLNGVIPLLM